MNKKYSNKKIEIVLGFACNNNCKFCSVGNRKFNKSINQIKEEIDRAEKDNPYEINFTGGEPTIRKDIFEIISYANGKAKDIRITTNGRLLSYKWFTEKIVDAGLTGAIFSLHGSNPETHDYLTSVKGSFNQLMKGMENLSNLVDNISINVVLTTHNYKQLVDIVKMTVDRFHVRTYCFIFPTIDGNILNHKELIPKYEDIRHYAHEALELVRKKGRAGWTLNIPPCFLEKEEKYSGIMNFNTIMYWPEMITDLDKKKLEGKIRIPECYSCKFREKCPGIPKDYYELYMKK